MSVIDNLNEDIQKYCDELDRVEAEKRQLQATLTAKDERIAELEAKCDIQTQIIKNAALPYEDLEQALAKKGVRE